MVPASPLAHAMASSLHCRQSSHRVSRLIQFPTRRTRKAAAYALELSARWQRLSTTKPWIHSRAHPEQLYTMLQRLAEKRPAILFVIEKLIAEMIDELDE